MECGMTKIHHYWSGLLLFLVVICCVEPLQDFKVRGIEERVLNAKPVDTAGNKTINGGRQQEANEHPDENENSTAVLLGHAHSHRRPRNIVGEAKETVKSATEKLAWVKKNFRYLLLMVGSVFFLFFSCVAYRRLTRNRDDEDGDEVKVVVIGGPKEKSTAQGTLPSVPTTPKGTNEASNTSTTKNISKPLTKATRKTKNAKSDEVKRNRKKADGIRESESHSNMNELYSDEYDSSDCGVISDDYMHDYAEVEDEQSKTRLFDSLLKYKKIPFPQIKIDACVINEGIPLSSYTSFQQTHQSETELNICEPISQYVDEIRKRAKILNGKRQVTNSTTSYSQYPVLEDLEQRLVACNLEKCGSYHPMASTCTRLPITVASK